MTTSTFPQTMISLTRGLRSHKRIAQVPQSNRYVVGLDVIRLMAALYVMLIHFNFFCYQSTGVGFTRSAARFIISSGWIGVEIFFVLSGFVIAYSIRSCSAGEFVKRRVARLWPGMLFCASLSAVLGYLDHFSGRVGETINLWKHSILFQPGEKYIDASHWTLPTEVQFYGVIVLLLIFQKRKIAWRAVEAGAFLSAYYCFIQLLSLKPGAQFALKSVSAAHFFLTHQEYIVRYGLYFALGMCLQRCAVQGWTWGRVMFAAIMYAAACCEIVYHTHELASLDIQTDSVLFAVAVWTLALAAMVLSVRMNARVASWAGETGLRVIRRLGLMTYPIYLVHQSLAHFSLFYLSNRFGAKATLLLTMPVVVGLAYVSSKYLEPPISRWFLNIDKERVPKQQSAARQAFA